jgi:hypothetical protein
VIAGSVFVWIGALLIAVNAHAWEKHATLMPLVVAGGLSPEASQKLDRKVTLPCNDQDQTLYRKLASEFHLNSGARLPSTAERVHRSCGTPISARDLLRQGGFVDDPDLGMDENLGDDADPENFRRWMGGKTGATSKGFRHMYFGGWKWRRPLTTFQIPITAIGYAPQRAQLFAVKARELLATKGPNNQVAWGYRLLSWSMHYLQDLAQPFHSVQIVHPRMVPWFSLYEWPPQKGFETLVKETTRSIVNYHWVYEGYTLEQISSSNPSYEECLIEAERFATIHFDPKNETPKMLAHSITRGSVKLAPAVGRAEMKFFGGWLKNKNVDIPAHPDEIDYHKESTRPDRVEERESLRVATCPALANAIYASRQLIEWALQP